jgi:hypothetical protein
MGTDQPPLPRPPDDADALQRLREEAMRRMENEPRPVYGGPAPVYGGPPVTRRWTLRGILMLIAGAVAAIAGGIWGYEKMTTPVYGGPPAPEPKAVYGGPTPPPNEAPK